VVKMKLIFVFLTFPFFLQAQNKNITLGYSQNGIVIGNSYKCNGIRFNFWDKNVESLNGISFSVKSNSTTANGISVGLLVNNDSISNGIKIGGIGNGAKVINGVGVGGLFNFAEDKFNGVGITGVFNGADTMNGVFISCLGTIGGNQKYIKKFNGLTIGMIIVGEKFNGLSIGFMSGTDSTKGVNIGFVGNESKSVKGAQIAIVVNRTEHLFGFQFGLWNIAENKRFLKRMPILNFNFRRKANSSLM
jgi:hypothetical protein